METEILRVLSQTTLCFVAEGFCLSAELRMKEGCPSSHRLLPPEGEALGRWREAKELKQSSEGSSGAM